MSHSNGATHGSAVIADFLEPNRGLHGLRYQATGSFLHLSLHVVDPKGLVCKISNRHELLALE